MDRAHREYLQTYQQIKSADTIAMTPAGELCFVGTPRQFLHMVKIDENHNDELIWKKRVKTAAPELNPKTLYVSRGWSGRFKKFTFPIYDKINKLARKDNKRYLKRSQKIDARAKSIIKNKRKNHKSHNN